MKQGLERQVLSRLVHHGCLPLGEKKILEVGCGTGPWLRDLVKWGASPENLFGIDLLPQRVFEARRLCPAQVNLLCGGIAVLSETPKAIFDIVLQATVFTSVLNSDLRQSMALSMLRLVKPNGFIFWYDFRLNNPGNPDVRGVKRKEIFRLFPGCRIELIPTTLAPPIVRLLAPRSWLFCSLLEKIPWLCTHYLGVIQKR
jgi:SAM-dependent methyltransferase